MIGAITFKQLEALYWSAELGTFKAASGHLNTTQSAIAKRIRELEAALGIELFYRAQKYIMLTPRGEEVLTVANEMIQLKNRLGEVAVVGNKQQQLLRLGITDLTAMTWLGSWLKLIQQQDPDLIVIPQVDLSARLFEDLINEKLDLIIVPDAFTDPRFEKLFLEKVPNAWVASPLYTNKTFMTAHEISQHTVITQTSASGVGHIFSSWLSHNHLTLSTPMHSSNFGAMISLVTSGVGIAFLPKDCLSDIIGSGRMNYIGCDKALPDIRYVALYRRVNLGGPLSTLTDTIRAACDFSRPLWSLPDKKIN